VRGLVADTNIYISAFNFGGIPNQVLDLGRERRIEIFVCEPILNEIRGVLREKFRWSSQRIMEALADINGFAKMVELRESVAVVEKDDADNRILECAVSANAEIIVSGDSHLRELHSFRGIKILSPREFLDAMH
jgi:uncharacterized protein